MKRAFRTVVVPALAGVLAVATTVAAGDAGTALDQPPPSILLLVVDTLRADHVGCYGDGRADTGTIDSIAAAGVRFDEARSHVPLTLPSHATILTGRLPPRTGIRGNGLFRLASDLPTLAEALRAKGYRTAAVVASAVLDRVHGLDRGFDVYDDNQRIGPKARFQYIERGADQVAVAAKRELENLGSEPFFLWVHFFDPHFPWMSPKRWADRFPGRGYDGEIAFADAALGEVLEAARRKAGGNLVVAVISDHGESLGEHGETQHGYTLHRGVLRVPFVLSGPSVPSKLVVAEPIGLVDLAPTLAEMAGTGIEGADGRSLSRFWKEGSPPSPRPGASIEGGGIWEESLHPLYDSGWAPLRGLLETDWHFVDAPRPELYDRRKDPADTKDLSRRQRGAVSALRAKLSGLAEELGDVAEPTAPSGHGEADRERLAKLASLGYLAGAAARPHAGPRLDPKDGVAGFVALERAMAMIGGNRAAEAKALVEPFLKKDPANPRLWHGMGLIRAALRDVEGADRDFRKAISLDGESDFLRLAYAELLSRKGDLDGARLQLETVVAANPRAVDASLELASLAVRRGDIAASERILRASHDAGARDPDLLDRLALHLLLKGERGEAARLFAEALELDPDDGVALLQTGKAAMREGEVETALGSFRRCALGPKAFECRMEIVRALIVTGRDLPEARVQLENARRIAASDAQRREVDARLAELAEREAGK